MDDVTFKNRNLLVLLFEVFLIIAAIGGLTFATSKLMGGSSTIVTFGEYNVEYIGKTEVTASNLEPISEDLINYDTRDGVIRLEFSLKGVDTNKDSSLIYDIMLREMHIDCSLLNEYTKWNLYKNGELLSQGNFSPKFDGNVLTDDLKLTEIQQDLPKYDSKYDDYVLLIWISEACENLETCTLVDQSGIVNSTMDMKVFVAVSGGEKVPYERIPNMDATCVNQPELMKGMFPVYYDNGDWKIADKTNSSSDAIWYDYGKSKWANAVFVNTQEYDTMDSGTIIKQEDILGYYVWVPRFKYRLWNVEGATDSLYDAYNQGIDIVFESGVHSSGDAKCTDSKCVNRGNGYLTHPAFGDDSRGFWISKYEISDGDKFVPNANALLNAKIEDYTNRIGNLSKTYGIDAMVDSHIVTNLEWGATLYLSHSKYGMCSNKQCTRIGINSSYVSENNKQDSTTGNVFGVYDMAGGAAEYAVGSVGIGSATSEVVVKENQTWDNGMFMHTDKNYTLRGGMDKGLFYTGDIGMFDVSTRSVLVSK